MSRFSRGAEPPMAYAIAGSIPLGVNIKKPVVIPTSQIVLFFFAYFFLFSKEKSMAAVRGIEPLFGE